MMTTAARVKNAVKSPLTMIAFIVCLVSGVLVYGFVASVTTPELRWELNPSRIVKTSDAVNSPLHGVFEVKNTGRQSFRFGGTTTTCGCTVASIEPKLLQPGQSAQIKVEGSPPVAGERDVRIEVDVIGASTKSFGINFVMISGKMPPFIVSSPRSINVSATREHASEELLIDTREVEGSPPWLTNAKFNDNVLVASILESGESKVSEGVVHRQYKIGIRVAGKASEGLLSDHLSIKFRGVTNAEDKTLEIPCMYQILPLVRAVPATLHMNDESNSTYVVLLVDDSVTSTASGDTDQEFTAQLSDESLGIFSVQATRLSKKAIKFTLTVKYVHDAKRLNALEFITNRLNCKTVKINLVR